jgi:hypothetical protein
MAFNVTEFRANMLGDGARPNLFQVTLTFPTIADSDVAGQRLSFMAKTAQLPGSTVGVAPVFYFGREVKFPGNRTFPDWSVTIINDEDFNIRNAFERWMDSLNSHTLNVRNPLAINQLGYTTDATVTQFSKAGVPIKSYKFVGMFPTDVSPIELDWGSNDSIEEFGVTLAYQYWEADTTT